MNLSPIRNPSNPRFFNLFISSELFRPLSDILVKLDGILLIKFKLVSMFTSKVFKSLLLIPIISTVSIEDFFNSSTS